MPLSKYQSTSGSLLIAEIKEFYVRIYNSWQLIMTISVPWPGTITYVFTCGNPQTDDVAVLFIKLNNTAYGGYWIPASSVVTCSIDYAISSPSNINVYMQTWTLYDDVADCRGISLRTGNADCMYKACLSPVNIYDTTIIT